MFLALLLLSTASADTIPSRIALREAVVAADAWYRASDKQAGAEAAFIDLNSFKRVTRDSTSPASSWTGIAGALGARGRSDRVRVCGEARKCPEIAAMGIRAANDTSMITVRLTVSNTTPDGRMGQRVETLTVMVTRLGSSVKGRVVGVTGSMSQTTATKGGG